MSGTARAPDRGMGKRNCKGERRGARLVVTEDQWSFVDEEPRRGTHFDGGRKTQSLEHVGVESPDTDADAPVKPGR